MAGNPFYTSRLGRQVGGSLGDLFRVDPQNEAAMAARMSQSRLYDTQADEVAARVAANPRAAEALARNDLPGYYVEIARGGSAPLANAAPGFVLGYGAASGQPSGRLSDLFVGAGHSEAGSPRGFATSQATTRRGQDINSGDDRYRTDQSRAGALERERLQQQGLRDRTDINLPNNADVVVGPNHPLAGQATDGRITGPRVQTGTGAGRAPQPLDVNGTDAKAIDEQIIANLPEGAALDQAAAAQVRARAAELYGAPGSPHFRNMVGATRAAVEEFMGQNPPRTDSRLNPFSSRTYGPPQAGAAPTAPQPVPGAVRDGQTATNPQTGQKLIRQNGRWVPLS